MTNSWTAARIALVGAKPIVGAEVTHVSDLRGIVASTRDLLHKVDLEMSAIENSQELTSHGKNEKLKEVASRYLPGLERLEATPSSVTRRLDTLNKKVDGYLDEARKGLSPAMASEVRAHIKQSGGMQAALGLTKSEPRVLVAVLDGLPFLSGLSEADTAVLKRESTKHLPEAREQDQISKSLAVVSDAVKVARAMISERSGLANAAPTLKAV